MLLVLIGILTWSITQNVVYYFRVNDRACNIIDLTGAGYPPVGGK